MTRLRLQAYDPAAELRARAARAVENFTREYKAVKDPGVRIAPGPVARNMPPKMNPRKKRAAEKAYRALTDSMAHDRIVTEP